jgi:2,3-bisphosphoglycerate-independent phosphoglycerate mutase
LIILDGWGHRTDPEANAIEAAKKPYWNELWEKSTHTLLTASGRDVGLPIGQMGNSEVGHLNLGAGRIVHQDLTKIDLEIENSSFFSNPALAQAIQSSVTANKALHLFGLLSPGGVHSHENHLHALLELAAQHNATQVYLHAFLDGRDTPPRSAHASLVKLIAQCNTLKCGQIISVVGRYYAMDRDKRWDRVQKAYDLVCNSEADFQADNPLQALDLAYARGENDEFVKPTAIRSELQTAIKINDGDTVIFMNFRADRARELTQAFIAPDFSGFVRKRHPKLAEFVSLSEYDALLNTTVAYPTHQLTNILGECISNHGLNQLRIAETEKYAHVTFFFNGGIETPFAGEDRILIPSPKVSTYDLQPEMSARQLTDELIKQIHGQHYDVIICNFANPDMLGHTGNFLATVKAIEIISECLEKIISALKEVKGEALITADHGNAELMFDNATGQPHTAHTLELVPFIYVGREANVTHTNGLLSDVAPTMLHLLGIEQPVEMTGKNLLEIRD